MSDNRFEDELPAGDHIAFVSGVWVDDDGNVRVKISVPEQGRKITLLFAVPGPSRRPRGLTDPPSAP